MTGKMFSISPERVGRGQEGKERVLESGSSMSEKRQFRLITSALNKKQENILHGESHFSQPSTFGTHPQAPDAKRNLDRSEKNQDKPILKNKN